MYARISEPHSLILRLISFRAQFARAFEKQVLDKMIDARRFVRAEGQYDGEGYAVQPLVLRGEHRGAVG